MIVPPRDAHGQPNLDSLNTWHVGCDRADCGTTAPLRDCADWCIGLDTSLRVYCPRCERRIARNLISSALHRTVRGRFALRMLLRAVGRRIR